MKKILKITSILIILLGLVFTISLATSEKVNSDELTSVISSDVFLTEDNIVIEETVDGNLYLIGSKINVSSEINGNIFAIGDEIIIGGKINGSIYAISSDVKICGDIRDLYLITDTVEITEQATCRDIKAIAPQINLLGYIERDVYSLSSEVNIKNTENAKIGGVLYTSGEVVGEKEKVNSIKGIDLNLADSDEAIYTILSIIKTFYFITMCVTAFVIIAVLVGLTKKNTVYKTDLKKMFLYDTFKGLINWFLCVCICLALIFTIFGIPLAILFAGLVWLLFWKVNIPVASIEISKFVLKNNCESKLVIFLVAFIFFVLINVLKDLPVIGMPFFYIISLYGFGYIYRRVFKRNKEEKIEVEVVQE